ncbi:MAG: NADH:ubiquinone reductase (Na(+)-transporting) subunit F, partial [Paludibacteraceae bacterium]|nr:NADH:ubiquinone reductase (Na(+)-transporting) subunit F [Paludibacteraceae bacterium]
KADQLGIKYTPGFIAPVMGDTYLKQHDAPEDIEYYLGGPPMMAKTVRDRLHSLGVDDADIRFDNFGG